jgi:hypothetical protein
MSRRVRVLIDGKPRWLYQHEIDHQIRTGKMRWSQAAGDVLIRNEPQWLVEQKLRLQRRLHDEEIYQKRVLASEAERERSLDAMGVWWRLLDEDRPPKRHRKRRSK